MLDFLVYNLSFYNILFFNENNGISKTYLTYYEFIISLNICIEQSQYNAQKAGITSAIVIAVLLPIGICGFCLLLQLRNKAADVREKKEGGGGGYNTYNQGPM